MGAKGRDLAYWSNGVQLLHSVQTLCRELNREAKPPDLDWQGEKKTEKAHKWARQPE